MLTLAETTVVYPVGHLLLDVHVPLRRLPSEVQFEGIVLQHVPQMLDEQPTLYELPPIIIMPIVVEGHELQQYCGLVVAPVGQGLKHSTR